MENNEYANAGSGSNLECVVPHDISNISKIKEGRSTGNVNEYLEKNGEMRGVLKKNTREDFEKFIKAYPDERPGIEIGE